MNRPEIEKLKTLVRITREYIETARPIHIDPQRIESKEKMNSGFLRIMVRNRNNEVKPILIFDEPENIDTINDFLTREINDIKDAADTTYIDIEYLKKNSKLFEVLLLDESGFARETKIQRAFSDEEIQQWAEDYIESCPPEITNYAIKNIPENPRGIKVA